jgi:hypothetical protein
MSNSRLAFELLDHTVDLLHDSRDTLKSCCLVSKSWIPRARKHLFASINLSTAEDLQAWKAMFPDPSTSPACYTKSLFVKCPLTVTASDAQEGGWIRTFSRVVHFEIDIRRRTGDYECFYPFHGFSPAIKSLLVKVFAFPPSRVFNFICSFPLLEDLSVKFYDRSLTIEGDDLDGQLVEIQSSTAPVFTGSLKLYIAYGMGSIASRLLSLPNGLRFWSLDLAWEHEDDVSLTRELVEMCHSTLQSLSIHHYFGTFVLHSRLDQ